MRPSRRHSTAAKPPTAVLIRLSGDADAAVALIETMYGLAQPRTESLAGAAKLARARTRINRLFVLGSPPSQEIGFGILPLVAIALRAKRVLTIDSRSHAVEDLSLLEFVRRALPFFAGQLAFVPPALAVQRLLGEALLRFASPASTPRSDRLRRVLYLRPHAGVATGVGGSVTHTHEVIRALRRLDIVVEPVTSDPVIGKTAQSDDDPPCDWTTLQTPVLCRGVPASAMLAADIKTARRAYRSALTNDVIYQRHARFSIVGALLSRLTGTPLFLEYNGSEVYTGSQWGQTTPFLGHLRLCERAALANATKIIVVAEASRAELTDRGVDPSRIVLNPNGVDPTRFGRGGGEAVRLQFDLETAEVIGFVGSFGPWHGAHVLASAFVEIASRRRDARLLLVGDGPERDRALAIIRDGGVADRVVVVGRVHPAKVAGYLDACDVLVSPHVDLGGDVEFFGSPTKIFEYMAAGKAIVASRLGQIGDVLTDNETALLVPQGDPNALAGAVERILEDPALAARLGANARSVATDRHDWRRNGVRLVEAYEGHVGASASLARDVG